MNMNLSENFEAVLTRYGKINISVRKSGDEFAKIYSFFTVGEAIDAYNRLDKSKFIVYVACV